MRDARDTHTDAAAAAGSYVPCKWLSHTERGDFGGTQKRLQTSLGIRHRTVRQHPLAYASDRPEPWTEGRHCAPGTRE